MTEALEMPKPASSGTKKRVERFLVFGLLLLLLVLCAIFWFWPRSLESSYALVDGTVFTVQASVSGRVKQLGVHEGDSVQAGDVVARMDLSAYSQERELAAREIRSLRPPDMEQMAGRLKEAQAAEENAIERLAKVRHEEEARRQQMEALVLSHVQAELAMRGIGDVNSPAYAAARAREEKTRVAMEEAKDGFEASSRIRAEVTKELARIRREVQEAKDARRHSRPAPSGPVTHNATLPDSVRAPVAGRVLRLSVGEGDSVISGDPLMLLLPEGEKKAFWVKAWFPVAMRKDLSPGASCRIEKEDGSVLRGRVEELLPEEPLPEGSGTERYLPLTVRLDGGSVLPGEKVRCHVRKAFW